MSASLGFDLSRPDAAGESEADDFRLLVFAHIDDPTEIVALLTSSAGLHPDDATRAAHLAPGLLPMRFTEDVAQTVVQQMELRGIRAIAVHNVEIPTLDPAVAIHHLRCMSEGVELFGIRGELKRLVRWSDLSLLSAGSVPMDDGQRLPAEPQIVLHAAPNPHRAVIESARRPTLILWMVCERPREIYRFVHNQMSYEHLGGRKTTSTMRNFCLFLEDLARQAPHAYLTPAMRALLQHGIRRHFEFHSPQELRDYTLFHLLAQRQVSQVATGFGASPADISAPTSAEMPTTATNT